MKYPRSRAEAGYVAGLQNAEAKGFAAGQDRQFTENDNPYRKFEHRKSWLDGFRRARKGKNNDQSH